VATYNVHRCVGQDGAERPDRVARVIEELDPDVLALQEVQGGPRAESDHLARLARKSGLAAVQGATLHDGRGSYGNALLTRLPVRSVSRLDLSVPGVEPRGALDVDLDAGGGLRVIATHLGLGRRERVQQVGRLLEALARRPGVPTLLLGDFNEWLPSRWVLRRLRRSLRPTPARPTFPAQRPLLPLDRVWAGPGCEIGRSAVHRSELARIASDHLPVRAEVVLAPRAPARGGSPTSSSIPSEIRTSRGSPRPDPPRR
jgi:endonuclease/exonuclease/phosphatase family metal-dependent hydrolase